MAKKSAASKGYRKVQKKKPFLTKKEIIALIIIVIVIIIGAAVIDYLPKVGTISASKIKSGDIISVANSDVKKRYKQVGTIGELEGYTMEASTSPDSPTGGYRFVPEDEDSSIEYVRVGGAVWDAERMIATNMSSIGADTTSDHTEEAIETTLCGNRAFISSSRYIDDSEETSGEEESVYSQFIYTYTDSIDGYSIALTCTLRGDDESIYVADEDLAEFVAQFEGAFIPAVEE